jgi:DNA-binding transcriptional ArsR family regulator
VAPKALLDARLRLELDELVAGMCKALNDPKRLLLLYALRFGPHTVSELCEVIEAPQSNTSQHLAVLRDRGLVEAERQGNNVLYSLRHEKVIDAIDILRGVMSDELTRQQSLRAPQATSA